MELSLLPWDIGMGSKPLFMTGYLVDKRKKNWQIFHESFLKWIFSNDSRKTFYSKTAIKIWKVPTILQSYKYRASSRALLHSVHHCTRKNVSSGQQSFIVTTVKFS